MRFIFFIIFSFAVLNLPAWVLAELPPVTEKQTELKKVTTRISSLETKMQSNERKKIAMEKELQKVDTKIGNLISLLDTTNKKLLEQDELLKQLKQNEDDYTAKLTDQHDELNKQLRAAYILSRESSLKVMLNQQNPAKVNRILNYYYYFDQARMQMVKQLSQTLTELKQNQSAMQQQTIALQQTLQQQQDAAEQLQTIKKTRLGVIKALNAKLNTDKENLSLLQSEKVELSTVIDKLLQDKKQVIFHATGPIRGSFADMLGKLHWPLTTHNGVRSGVQGAGHRDISTNAVIIKAVAGNPVYAIYPGRVVFAGWLRGFGLMMIIDHGQGYMSLYGRNDSLYHRAGDFVQAGELIAKVGNSGGYEESGLYFAIRHNGKPTDPMQWCRA